MTPLYSLRTEGDQYRITKFVDGDVEASYLVGTEACECPAGHRHTCRHRQMLPQMIAHGICNTHWFFAFDLGGQIVDFNGTPKRLFDELAASAPSHTDLMISPEAIDEALDQHGYEVPEGDGSEDDIDQHCPQEIEPTPSPSVASPQGEPKPWRRL